MAWRLFIQYLLMGLLLIVGQVAIGLISYLYYPEALQPIASGDLATAPPAMLYILFLVQGLAVICSVWVSGRFFDRRQFFDFGFKLNRRWWIDLCFGLLLGIILMTVIFLVELSLGWIKINALFVTNQINSRFVPTILLPLSLYIFVGFYEELYSRGYHLTNIAEGFRGKIFNSNTSLLLGTILSSAVFGIMHANNPNSNTLSSLNICLAGLLLSTGFITTGQLAIPIGLHISWNFFQGNIFGFPVSGINPLSATLIQIDQSGPDLWTGGAFGPEGGLIGTISSIVGILLIVVWTQNRYGKLRLQAEISEPPRGKWRVSIRKKDAEEIDLPQKDAERKPPTQYSHIIWDWNGTLLDDLQLCLRVINTILSKRNLPKVSKEKYLDIFGFPVIDYYQKLGFDFSKEPFENISTEFIDAYESGRPDCPLMPGVWDTLNIISSLGITQSILSASKKDHLNKAIRDYGLEGLFCSISGLDNHHAAGKAGIARSFMSETDLDPKRTILIGDTIHDAEIAHEINIDCWLIPNGHQSRQRLSQLNLPLVNSLINVKDLITSS
jgi:phosphoglycolate phosphatase-like HAD superfamily hydrolase/membrane protease YdiL (CAAX protease family)